MLWHGLPASDLALAPAMRTAEVCDGSFGPRVSYCHKVIIPFAKLCWDDCRFGTIAQAPHPGEKACLIPDEILERAGAAGGLQ